MNTEQEIQAIEVDLKSLLERLTEDGKSANVHIETSLTSFEADTDALEKDIDSAEAELTAFLEKEEQALDTFITEEQKNIAIEEAQPEEAE